jgi:hypothetical protein
MKSAPLTEIQLFKIGSKDTYLLYHTENKKALDVRRGFFYNHDEGQPPREFRPLSI